MTEQPVPARQWWEVMRFPSKPSTRLDIHRRYIELGLEYDGNTSLMSELNAARDAAYKEILT